MLQNSFLRFLEREISEIMKKRFSAFTLVEISVASVIIAMLIIGALKANKFVDKARLNRARAMTASSPVSYMSGVTLWLETTSEKSFTAADAQNGTAVSTWYDINPMIAANNATSTSSFKPIYTKKAMNGLPALDFDGIDDYIYPSVVPGFYDNFTVFVVASTSVTHGIDSESSSGTAGTSGQKYLIYPTHGTAVYGSSNYAGSGISFGTNGISVYEHTSSYMPALAVYSGTISSTPNIISWVCASKTHSLYLNGTLVRSGLTSAKSQVFVPYEIGGDSYGYFDGYIGEVIVIARYLTTEERKSVEAYLSKKWSIAVAS